MQQVIISKENGVTLTESKTVGIDLAKIISAKADGSDAEIVYDIGAGDRRIKPKVWTVLNTSATITTLMSTDATSVTAYDLSDGTTYTLVIHDSYIVSVSEATVDISGTSTSVRKIEYKEGAFMTKVVYVSDTLDTLATEAVTTTTTEAATTTTTEAATTTTTAG